MPDWLKTYGDTEGPLGFPMKDSDAKELEKLLASLPEIDYRKEIISDAITERSPGERSDVSWISTQALDRQKEIVLAQGMDDSHFAKNPIVTLSHQYDKAPIGKSLWRKRVREGERIGIKAKTLYPKKPDNWPDSEAWMPDRAFGLVQSGLVNGKSIGFLTLDASPPSEAEVKANPSWEGAKRIIRKWKLLEYACSHLPVNQECVVEQVSKGLVSIEDLKLLGLEIDPQNPNPPLVVPEWISFVTLESVQDSVGRELKKYDWPLMVEKALKDGYDRLRGRV